MRCATSMYYCCVIAFLMLPPFHLNLTHRKRQVFLYQQSCKSMQQHKYQRAVRVLRSSAHGSSGTSSAVPDGPGCFVPRLVHSVSKTLWTRQYIFRLISKETQRFYSKKEASLIPPEIHPALRAYSSSERDKLCLCWTSSLYML